MKTKQLLVALLAVFALLAAACGSDSDDSATESDDTTTETAETEEDSGGEEEAMEEDGEEEAMEEEEAPADSAAGSGGELVLLQWQAPSQANGLLSNGTKDLLASSLVLEPLAEYGPDGSLIPALATEIPSSGNGGIAADNMSITWTLRDDVMWSDGTPFTADDVVFTYEISIDAGCNFTRLFAAPPYAIVSINDPLAQQDSTSLEELSDRAMVLLDLPQTHDYFMRLFSVRGLRPTIAHSSRSSEIVRALVSQGYGFSILNIKPVEYQEGYSRYRILPIRNAPEAPVFGIARLSSVSQSRMTRSFIQSCIDLRDKGALDALTVPH